MGEGELIQALAKVSHQTWKMHEVRDKGKDPEAVPDEVTAHDVERAMATVEELKKLRQRHVLPF